MKNSYTRWTDEICLLEAKKYQTRKDFLNNSPRIYKAIKRRDKEFQDKCFGHMIYLKQKYKYTKEEILKMASEYDSPIDLSKRNRKLYRYVERYNLYKEVKYKIGQMGDKLKRMVYVYEFPDNHFYCGLTYNERVRHLKHLSLGPVYNHIQKTNTTPIYIKKSSYISAQEAALLEENTRLLYIENGWTQLNKKKCGGLGGVKETWTKEKIMKLALNFTRPSRFKNKHLGAYNAAKSLGIYDEVTKHMKHMYKKEDIIKLTKKYLFVKDFKKNHPQIYIAIVCNKWTKEIFSNHIKFSKLIIVNKFTGIFYYYYKEAYNSKSHNISFQHFQDSLRGIKENSTDFLLV